MQPSRPHAGRRGGLPAAVDQTTAEEHTATHSTNLYDREADLTGFGVATSNGIEYGADCVAEAWGHAVAIH